MPSLPQIPEGARVDPRGERAREQGRQQAPWNRTADQVRHAIDDAFTPHPGQFISTPHPGQNQATPIPAHTVANPVSHSAPASPAVADEIELLGNIDVGGPTTFNFDEWIRELDAESHRFAIPRPADSPGYSGIAIQARTRQFLGLDDNTPRASQYDNTPRASQYNATPRASQYNNIVRPGMTKSSHLDRISSDRIAGTNDAMSSRARFAQSGGIESSTGINVPGLGIVQEIPPYRGGAVDALPRSASSSHTVPFRAAVAISVSKGFNTGTSSIAAAAASAPVTVAQGIAIPPSATISRHSSQHSASSLSSVGSGVRSSASSSAAGSTRSRVANFFSRHDNTSQNSLHAAEYKPDDPEYWIGNAATRFREMGPDDPVIEFDTSPHFIQSVPHAMHDVAKTSKLRITVDITRVIHGTWQGSDAVFVGLTVSHQLARVIETDVTIKVATGGLGGMTMEEYETSRVMEEPVIRQFAPKIHYGVPTPVNQSTTVGVTAGLSAPTPAGPAANVSGNVGRTTEQVKEQRHTVTGYTSSEKRESNRTIFNLNALENASDEKGIYPELPIGLVIETRGKPVVLAVDVKSRLPPTDRFTIFRNKYSWSVPVYIDSKDWPGDPVRLPIPKEISEWGSYWLWRRLVTYTGYAENVSRAIRYPMQYSKLIQWEELVGS